MGENRYLLGCFHYQLKRPPLHWKEKIPVVASLQELEQEFFTVWNWPDCRV